MIEAFVKIRVQHWSNDADVWHLKLTTILNNEPFTREYSDFTLTGLMSQLTDENRFVFCRPYTIHIFRTD